MTKYTWVQPDKKKWTVEIDHKAGVIEVFDETGKSVLKREGLPPGVIAVMETVVFGQIATREIDDSTQNMMYI